MSSYFHTNDIELRFFINRNRDFLKNLIRNPFSIFSRNDFYLENNLVVARNIRIVHRSLDLFNGDVYFEYDTQGLVVYTFKDYRGFKIKVLMRLERFLSDTDLIRIRVYPEQDSSVYYDDLVLFSEAIRELFITYLLENNYKFKSLDRRETSDFPA